MTSQQSLATAGSMLAVELDLEMEDAVDVIKHLMTLLYDDLEGVTDDAKIVMHARDSRVSSKCHVVLGVTGIEDYMECNLGIIYDGEDDGELIASWHYTYDENH